MEATTNTVTTNTATARLGGYTAIIGAVTMVLGAVLWGISGADLDLALATATSKATWLPPPKPARRSWPT